ncbi:TrlF family AAA-like ATPase [Pantoea cypripedii]|uniref:RecF/RecN/SMC N-terminal domain-containing protein n=1 Tax=Pantoea cypripedii TaxID=55209 RepID=A0A1X1EPK8_PANCY|nr:AAA family ATPase [Pantoea cypripedii]MBP2195845.1 energy-coupling factor transporter ATP-binding protein EcfA2 [Pantoea cypripedii]ORM91824.1 hypothetical protein HA50_00030 [Pantoea cypripedii]
MEYIGSKWWKFDFHTHTPVSMDYGKSDHEIKASMTPRQWLMDYISQGIECIAVTDHNSGEWIDKLKIEAETLRSEGYSIFIFPGVEISSHGNIHILGIFDPNKTSSSIAQIIGEVKYNGKPGDSDAVTECSPQEVIDIIIKRDGVAIPAHIDKPSGLCLVHKSGSTLNQILNNASAVEVIRTHAEYEAKQPDSSPLKGYINLGINLPEVLGSDAHHPNKVGRSYTWVKMGMPSIEGLKLALLDGKDSIKRSDQHKDSPNIYSDKRITSIRINGTKYCGRNEEFKIDFHPWLNCIIGGRGSGKSTILEFLRTALCRENELSQLTSNDDLFKSYSKLAQKAKTKDDDGVFLDETEIIIGYKKENVDYILSWDFKNKRSIIYRMDGENRISEEGDVASRFPVKIFSQKQIYEISKSPNYLLKLIDESSDVDFQEWEYRWHKELSSLLQHRREVRELKSNISTKGTLQGQLNDTNQKINSIEKSGHSLIFSNYQKAIIQSSKATELVNSKVETLSTLEQQLSTTQDIKTDYENIFETTENGREFISKFSELEKKLNENTLAINNLIKESNNEINAFKNWLNTSNLTNEINNSKKQYNDLVSSLQESGIKNPSDYGPLIASRKVINERLGKITLDEEKIKKNNEIISNSYRELIKLRKEITEKRKIFLSKLNINDGSIKVNIEFCGDNQHLDSGFRNVIGRNDATYSNEIYNDEEKGFLNVLHNKIKEKGDNQDEIISLIGELKKPFFDKTLDNILGVSIGKRFSDLRSNIPDEMIDLLIGWFPNDAISVKFRDGKRFKDISQGSAGQKAATVLAFLLSYGNDPLILDQPEDDLDNQLIYELIVRKIKENKKNRQILVVTHNANIVVNGDSELVVALSQQTGLTKTSSNGCLQERAVRHAICEIMEGGRDAFHQRYRRIINS